MNKGKITQSENDFLKDRHQAKGFAEAVAITGIKSIMVDFTVPP